MDIALIAKLRPIAECAAEAGCQAFLSEANGFLNTFRWAKRTGKAWVADCVPGVWALFLFELDAAAPDVGKYIWTVVGDLPPAYISTVYAKSPRAALDGYIGEMQAWIDAVENGQPVDDLIPVNAAPTLANAESLGSRLDFLRREMFPRLPV